MPIAFSLFLAISQAATPQPVATLAADDVVKCRTLAVTGSMVRKSRVCRTVAQWRRLSDAGNRDAREMLRESNICGGDPACFGK